MATKLSRKRRVPDYRNKRGLLFEHAEPSYIPNADDIARGFFVHNLLHTNIAAEHGLFMTINGAALGSEWWTLDALEGVVTVTIPDWVADAPEGFREFGWPMYAYRWGVAAPGVVPFTKRTGSWRSGGDTITGLAPGDLVVLAAYNTTTAGTSDSRFATVWSRTAALEWGDTGPVVVRVASIDSDVSNVALAPVSAGAWYVLTPKAGRSLTRSWVSEQPTIMACGSGKIPALPGTGSGALGFSFQRGPIGGAYGGNVWPVGWSNDGDIGTYEVVAFASTSMAVVGAVPSPHTDPSDSWVGCVIGLGLG